MSIQHDPHSERARGRYEEYLDAELKVAIAECGVVDCGVMSEAVHHPTGNGSSNRQCRRWSIVLHFETIYSGTQF